MLSQAVIAGLGVALLPQRVAVNQTTCPNCGGPDLVNIQLAAIDGEPRERHSSQWLCAVKHELDGSTRLVTM
jgi:hypothetical protein